uniref:Uncharacterized protein n=1 Tax=Peronospora matthiolae TaxID=2874970 RepID=A0AAV1VN86_9STRA
MCDNDGNKRKNALEALQCNMDVEGYGNECASDSDSDVARTGAAEGMEIMLNDVDVYASI